MLAAAQKALLVAAIATEVAQSARLPYSHCRAMRSARAAGVRIAATKGKGAGAYATAPIAAGAFVAFYEGETCTRAEAASRYWDGADATAADVDWYRDRVRRRVPMTGDYLFDLGSTFVDAEDFHRSNWCRFMNDAKKGTLAANVDTRVDRAMPEARLAFFAVRDIAAGEELQYSYGASYWDAAEPPR